MHFYQERICKFLQYYWEVHHNEIILPADKHFTLVFFSLKIFALSLEIIFQLRRPQRPHDVSLFDPVFRTRHQHHQHQGESPQPQRAVIDYKYLGESGQAHSHHSHSHRPTSQRSSLLFKEKDKSGEKLTKRMLVNEGLGR